MKAEALALCEVQQSKKVVHWRNDAKLMDFLRKL